MKLFISYAHDDEYLVRTQLVEILTAAGHAPWFDHQLIVGRDWKQQLLDAISACDAFVYALTPESVRSEWCQWEFSQAVALGKPVIPVVLQRTQLPPGLDHIQYVDFTQGATGKSAAKLMRGLAEIQVRIPKEQVSAPPDQPRGVPSRAVQPPQTRRTLPGSQPLILAIGAALIIALLIGFSTDTIPGLFRTAETASTATLTITPHPTRTPTMRPSATVRRTVTATQAPTVRPSATVRRPPTVTQAPTGEQRTPDMLAPISDYPATATPVPTQIQLQSPATVPPTSTMVEAAAAEPSFTVICYATVTTESGEEGIILPIVRAQPSQNAIIIASVRSSTPYAVVDRYVSGRNVWYQFADEAQILGWISQLDVTLEDDCVFD